MSITLYKFDLTNEENLSLHERKNENLNSSKSFLNTLKGLFY